MNTEVQETEKSSVKKRRPIRSSVKTDSIFGFGEKVLNGADRRVIRLEKALKRAQKDKQSRISMMDAMLQKKEKELREAKQEAAACFKPSIEECTVFVEVIQPYLNLFRVQLKDADLIDLRLGPLWEVHFRKNNQSKISFIHQAQDSTTRVEFYNPDDLTKPCSLSSLRLSFQQCIHLLETLRQCYFLVEKHPNEEALLEKSLSGLSLQKTESPTPLPLVVSLPYRTCEQMEKICPSLLQPVKDEAQPDPKDARNCPQGPNELNTDLDSSTGGGGRNARSGAT